jgi:hypothetical protein
VERVGGVSKKHGTGTGRITKKMGFAENGLLVWLPWAVVSNNAGNVYGVVNARQYSGLVTPEKQEEVYPRNDRCVKCNRHTRSTSFCAVVLLRGVFALHAVHTYSVWYGLLLLRLFLLCACPFLLFGQISLFRDEVYLWRGSIDFVLPRRIRNQECVQNVALQLL